MGWMRIGGMLLVTLLLTLSLGCQRGPRDVRKQVPSVKISASDRSMFVGESIWVFAQSRNMLNRDAEIEWETNIGEIEKSEQGRRALFTSETPGTAIITARVQTEEGTFRDTVRINVNSVR